MAIFWAAHTAMLGIAAAHAVFVSIITLIWHFVVFTYKVKYYIRFVVGDIPKSGGDQKNLMYYLFIIIFFLFI